MESYESILESEWSALNAMHSSEESDFIAQLLTCCSIPNDLHSGSILTSPSNNTIVDHVDRDFDHILATNNHFVLKTSCTTKEQNVVLQKQSSSSCSSEKDSIASHELNGDTSNSSESKEATAVNSNGKLRAVRGSATDPQSLYARKRRERINERLRTLQNLVPNGTKVDISTMLEDAVQYVKFLQLQIQLLSSDDKWMYAPIAYNGTDVRT